MKNVKITEKLSEDFFDILLENDKDKIHDYILSHGKAGKPVAPIMFIKDKDSKESEING